MRRLSIKLLKKQEDEVMAGFLIQSTSKDLNEMVLSDKAIGFYLEELVGYSLKQIKRGLRALMIQKSMLSLALLIESIEEQKKPGKLCENLMIELIGSLQNCGRSKLKL